MSFAGAPASAVTFVGPGTLRATVPAGSGVVDVTVTTTGGTSATNSGDRFTYAPTTSITVPAQGAVYTQTQVVAAQFACAASAPGNGICSAPVPSGSPLDTATTGAHQFTVTATDANGVQAASTAAYTVVAPPSARVLVPAAGATYAQGQRVLASYTCAASAPVGVAGCRGPVADGAAIDTSALGAHRFSVSSTDADGVSVIASVSYKVVAALPRLSGLRESAGRWLERAAASSRLPVGTAFSFTLDQAATVTLRFARILGGRLAGRTCHAGARHGAPVHGARRLRERHAQGVGRRDDVPLQRKHECRAPRARGLRRLDQRGRARRAPLGRQDAAFHRRDAVSAPARAWSPPVR